jgi:hypothetical protein
MKVAAAGAVAFMCIALTGCADQTGEIDPQGHNGFDRMTCQDSKAFAFDVMCGTVTSMDEGRIQQIATEMKQAGDADIRQASGALIAGYRAGNRRALTAAAASLAKVCQV